MVSLSCAEQERLIRKYMPFAHNISGKIAAKVALSFEDARQAGYLGLVEAASRFDLSKHDPDLGSVDEHFKLFAYLRIHGAVIDECRLLNNAKRGHPRMHSVPLDKEVEFEDGSIEAELAAPMLPLDDLIGLRDVIGQLSPREYDVLMSSAIGWSGRELGERYGVGPSRISQIATEARDKLQLAMEE